MGKDALKQVKNKTVINNSCWDIIYTLPGMGKDAVKHEQNNTVGNNSCWDIIYALPRMGKDAVKHNNCETHCCEINVISMKTILFYCKLQR
jgi:hypothetical protein